MASEDELRAKLRRIEALIAGGGTAGERDAAGAALERVKARLAEQARIDPPIEVLFSMPDAWSRQLFVALCRRYGLKPYRYKRQKRKRREQLARSRLTLARSVRTAGVAAV